MRDATGSMTEIDEKIRLLKDHSLTDEEIETIANHEHPDWAKPDARSVFPVGIDDGELRIGEPYTYEDDECPRWSENVIGTIGAEPSNEREVRRAWAESKKRMLHELRRQRESKERSL